MGKSAFDSAPPRTHPFSSARFCHYPSPAAPSPRGAHLIQAGIRNGLEISPAAAHAFNFLLKLRKAVDQIISIQIRKVDVVAVEKLLRHVQKAIHVHGGAAVGETGQDVLERTAAATAEARGGTTQERMARSVRHLWRDWRSASG